MPPLLRSNTVCAMLSAAYYCLGLGQWKLVLGVVPLRVSVKGHKTYAST